MFNKTIKKLVRNLLPIAIVFWSLFSLKILIDAGSMELFGLYSIYLIYMMVIAILCRDNILQPAGVAMLVGFLAFGNNIPLFANGMIGEYRPIDSRIIIRVLNVFLLSQLAFAFGTLLKLDSRFSPTRFLLHSKFKQKPVTAIQLIMLILFVVVAGVFRVVFHIGAAKEWASIPYSGLFHYALLDGLLVVLLWYLAGALKQKSLAYTLIAGIPLLLLVITQALLGWRGMIFRVMICVVIVFWFQKRLYQNERVRSFAWLVLLGGIGFFTIQLGHETRSQKTGSDSDFSKSVSGFVEKVQLRSQGTTRLAEVLNRFDDNVLTNNWFFMDLAKYNETATNYVDRVVYGVKGHQKHSVGCSGPGSVYVCAGLLGVGFVYFLWGVFFANIYEQIGFDENVSPNFIAIALYASLIDILVYTTSENFSVGVLKKLLCVLAVIYFCKIFLFTTSKKKKIPSVNPYLRGEARPHAR